MTILIILGWLLCALGSTGLWFAHAQGKFPSIAAESRREDLGFSILFSLLSGPIGLVLAFFMTGFGQYGWRLR